MAFSRALLGSVVGVGILAASASSAQPLRAVAAPMLAAAGAMHGAGQGYLGVATRTIGDPVLGPLHLKEAHGACVVMVDHDSPAWKAGIREHDVLVSLAGTAIDSEEQLARMLRETQPGRSVPVGISRDGAVQVLTVVIADRDEVGRLAWEQHFVVPAPADSTEASVVAPAAKGKSSSMFSHSLMGSHLLPGGTAYTGAMVDEIGPQLAEYFGLKTGKGLLVQSVDGNSPAALAGLHAGDVICKVNGQSVSTRTDWTRALHDSKGHPVSVSVMREHREQILTIVPDGKRRSDAAPAAPLGGEHHWLAVLLVRPKVF